MMRVPAAFKTAPRIPAMPGRPAPRLCKCGAALIPTYYAAGKVRGKRSTVVTPVLWCVHCDAAAFARPVAGQTEVRASTYMWRCAHCGEYMRRLHLTGDAYAGQGVPLSYCAACESVSFRPVLKRDESPKCHMCRASMPHEGRWCKDCVAPVRNWVRWNGSVPLPGEEEFEETIREVREYAEKMGYSWKAGMRMCTSCRKEFAHGATRKRRCDACLADQQLERERRRERGRRWRMKARMLAKAEAEAVTKA